MKISENFDSREIRCRCCGNWVGDHDLLAGLEALRGKVGRPVIITSGYRCAKRNQAVGGTPQSLHLKGKAADIRVAGMTGPALYEVARTIPQFRGFGVAEGWIHVDVRTGAKARWRYQADGSRAVWPYRKGEE